LENQDFKICALYSAPAQNCRNIQIGSSIFNGSFNISIEDFWVVSYWG